MSNINQRFREVREDQGLTLAAFGEKIGYDQSTVSRVERGKPPYEGRADDRYIIAVSRAYDVSEEWLRYGTGPRKPSTPESDPEEARVRWALSLFRQLCPEDQERIVAIAEEIVRVGKKKNADAGPADAAGEIRRRKSA